MSDHRDRGGNERATGRESSEDGTVDVSFAIASYNSGPYLDEAIASALAQDDVNVEVIIVDDGSDDGSLERAHHWAERETRVRALETPRNGGPGAARNLALNVMQGTWYAVLDSDDAINPGRSRLLIDAANNCGADMIADDLEVFGENIEPHCLIGQTGPSQPYWLDLETYLRRSCLFNGKPGYGFLKPMIRKSLIAPYRYDEDLRVGEDDELIVRLLAGGARYRCLPEAQYRYRKHGQSISHRLSPDHAQRMLEGETRLRAKLPPDVAESPAFDARRKALERGLAFVSSVEQIKNRDLAGAMRTLLRRPHAAMLYKMPISAAFNRRWRRR